MVMILNVNITDDDEIEPMRTGTAKGWNWVYKWVSLAVNEKNKHTDIRTLPYEWCKKNYGSEGVRWFEKKGKFFFKDEKDATMFILRWASN
jgi:hypothetical protein